MKRNLLSAFISILIILMPTGISAFNSFSDCSGHWAETSINYMQAKGYINGYSDGTFHPNGEITRAEFVTILANMNNIDKSSAPDSPTFTDVDADHWAYPFIEWASANKIVYGYENQTFRPSANISRQEIAALIYRYITDFKSYTPLSVVPYATFNDDADIAPWAKDYVYAMRASGIFSGRGNNLFVPLATATRAEAAKIITVYLQYYETQEQNLTDSVSLNFNGVPKAYNVPTLTQNGYTLIAARPFLEAAGYRVAYYNITGLIVAYNAEKDIEFFIGNTMLLANGIKHTLPVSVITKNGTTFIPLTSAAFICGFDTEFENNNSTVNIIGSTSPVLNGFYNFFGSASGSAVNGTVFLGRNNSNGFWGKLTNGQMSYGSYASGNGDLFFGFWQNGVLNGASRSVTMNGELFYGTYSNGNMATGVRYYTDGSIFEGSFQTGSHGAVYPQKGQYTDADGQKYGNSSTVWSSGGLSKTNW